LRNDVEQLKRILVPVMMTNPAVPALPAPGGMATTPQVTQIPLGEVADLKIVKGPTAIKSEEGLLTAYVFVDFSGRDMGGYVEEAKQKASTLKIPEGYRFIWSGEYENLTKTHERLKMVIPLTLFIIFILLYMNTRSTVKTMIVLLAVPFSLVGSFWLLYILNYNMSIAVWVGIIALAGLDAETGVVMLLYLDLAYEKWKKEGLLKTKSDLKDAIMFGAVKRIRPKIMTVSVIFGGTYPYHVQSRHRSRHHETHCRPNGRRRDYIHHFGVDYLSGHLHDLEGKIFAEGLTTFITEGGSA
jgi:Cu(I)/Ag(I) efflux system membrane protein CusA/SilA